MQRSITTEGKRPCSRCASPELIRVGSVDREPRAPVHRARQLGCQPRFSPSRARRWPRSCVCASGWSWHALTCSLLPNVGGRAAEPEIVRHTRKRRSQRVPQMPLAQEFGGIPDEGARRREGEQRPPTPGEPVQAFEEQKMQQSPGRGRSRAPQVGQSKKNWHESVGMTSRVRPLHSGHVMTASRSILFWANVPVQRRRVAPSAGTGC